MSFISNLLSLRNVRNLSINIPRIKLQLLKSTPKDPWTFSKKIKRRQSTAKSHAAVFFSTRHMCFLFKKKFFKHSFICTSFATQMSQMLRKSQQTLQNNNTLSQFKNTSRRMWILFDQQ